ncbi:MAG TPA: hypothetical protein VNA20_14935 [Frankiaceae bacterium]|nr:hypothetical protein [Frankiaceae bacterium]
MRSLLAAAVAALSLSAAPATAVHADPIVGSMTIVCYGCGPSSGTASLTVNGIYTAWASFSVSAPSSTCPATLVGNGTVSGYYNGSFDFYVYGGAMYLTIGGAHGGSGGGVFKADANLSCGATGVRATFAATIAGL